MVSGQFVCISIKYENHPPPTAACSTVKIVTLGQRNVPLRQRLLAENKPLLCLSIFLHLFINITCILFGDIIVKHRKRIRRQRIRMLNRKTKQIRFFAMSGQMFRAFTDLRFAGVANIRSRRRKPFGESRCPLRAPCHLPIRRKRTVNGPALVSHESAESDRRGKNHQGQRNNGAPAGISPPKNAS